MSGEIQILDPCTSDEWMQFVGSHPDAGIFHHPAWMKMLHAIYGYRFFAICIKKGNALCAGIPLADVRSVLTGNRWVSLPFSDHCRPLVPRDDPAAIGALMSYLKTQQESTTPKIEIRWEVKSALPTFADRSFVAHTSALGGKSETSLMKSFNQQVQRSIKKCEKESVIVRECTTYEEFESFHRLQVLTRKRLGVPAQPKAFFKGVWEFLITQGLGFALVAYKESTPIGGGVFFRFNGTMIYKYGASDLKYKALQPNYAFMWSAIKRALDAGCTTFDFGRSEKEHEGLRRFKMGWASEERELAYTILADRSPRNGQSRLNLLSGKVIRRSPTFVCTLSGELFYKHFA